MGRLGHNMSVSGMMIAAVTLASPGLAQETPDVRDKVAERFADTAVDTVDCEGFGPLCQVTAGRTVFYVDEAVRHAFIGRVYDLEAKTDLTARTLAVLAPSADTEGAPAVGLAWADLPWDSAIVRNEGGALKVAVFSDLHCGYCQRLSAALYDAPDIEAHEFLLGMAQSEGPSRAIGCAEDPEAALAAYYASRSLPAGSCDWDIVAPAREAAQRIGLTGTPTFLRPDGAVTAGFRDIETLRAWIAEGQAEETVQ